MVKGGLHAQGRVPTAGVRLPLLLPVSAGAVAAVAERLAEL
ncbi:hypothetical protein ACFWSF_11935 [Streptomyces sp. NPDC058611]